MPYNFLQTREATFFDCTLGYNFSNLFKKRLSSKVWDKTGIWLYAGASKLGRFADKYYYRSDGTRYTGRWKPTAQFMVKYNPIRFVFLGAGATYHDVDKDFRPLSFNLSAGLQL
jgi:hypothetical protein